MQEISQMIETLNHTRSDNHNLNLKNYDISLINAIKHLLDYNLYKLGFDFQHSEISINYEVLIYSVYYQRVDVGVIVDMETVLDELVDYVQIEAQNNMVKVEFVINF